MSSLSKGHGLHLLAAHRALARQLEEIERTGLLGRAPGSGGQRVTPVPPELWEEVGPALARISAISETIARRHAPDSFHAADSRQSLAGTLRWMSLLLRRLEETLEDLEPESIVRKFGPFSDPEEEARMAAEVAEIHHALAEAQAALENWRSRSASETKTA